MSAPAYKRFLDKLGEIIDELKKEEAENLLAAAEKMADCIENDHMIHLWGPGGHSAIVAEDALYRKGGLACVNPIYDPTMSLSHRALQEINHFEGCPGLPPPYGIITGWKKMMSLLSVMLLARAPAVLTWRWK